MVRPVGDYHPPEEWVKFETLKPGAKFHDCVESSPPVQFVKLQTLPGSTANAANLDTGEQVCVRDDEFVYRIDAGWVGELACYGFKISEELKAKGHRAILGHVFSQCEADKA